MVNGLWHAMEMSCLGSAHLLTARHWITSSPCMRAEVLCCIPLSGLVGCPSLIAVAAMICMDRCSSSQTSWFLDQLSRAQLQINVVRHAPVDQHPSQGLRQAHLQYPSQCLHQFQRQLQFQLLAHAAGAVQAVTLHLIVMLIRTAMLLSRSARVIVVGCGVLPKLWCDSVKGSFPFEFLQSSSDLMCWLCDAKL